MARQADQSVLDEAVAWHLRTAEGSEADWDEFVAWLEADPQHNAAYEMVVDAERELDGAVRMADVRGITAVQTRDSWLQTVVRAGWRIPAIAAGVALAVFGTWAASGGLSDAREIVTAPGEVRTIALAGGGRIVINGGTRIVLDRSDPRKAELKVGEAQFSVQPDPVHPFALTLGNQRVVDIGTVFNVFRSERTTRIEVAEGSVRFEDGETRLRLDAGGTLIANGDRFVEGSKPVAAIGSWTRGTLVYRDAPLVDVVGDLSRNRGIAIELGPELSDRTFTGVIQLGDNDEELRTRVGRLLGIKIARTADGWALTR